MDKSNVIELSNSEKMIDDPPTELMRSGLGFGIGHKMQDKLWIKLAKMQHPRPDPNPTATNPEKMKKGE